MIATTPTRPSDRQLNRWEHQRRDDLIKRDVSLHEAGHAVVLAHYGIAASARIFRSYSQPDGEGVWLGRVQMVVRPRLGNSSPTISKGTSEGGVFGVAGITAEALHGGESSLPEGLNVHLEVVEQWQYYSKGLSASDCRWLGTDDIKKISRYVGEAIRIITVQRALFDCIHAELFEKDQLTAREIDGMADELLVADPLGRLRAVDRYWGEE